MSERTSEPAIRMNLDGIEDFTTAAALLRAAGARRLRQGRNSRTFVIDQPLTPQQVAALLCFVDHGRAEGFLNLTVNPGEIDENGAEEWWETA